MSCSDRCHAFIQQVQGRLIVSCQALAHEPLFGASIMARLAIAAAHGGAAGIRANTPDDIRAIRAAVDGVGTNGISRALGFALDVVVRGAVDITVVDVRPRLRVRIARAGTDEGRLTIPVSVSVGVLVDITIDL